MQLGVYFSRFFTQSGMGAGDTEPLNSELNAADGGRQSNSGDIHFVSWNNPQQSKVRFLRPAHPRV